MDDMICSHSCNFKKTLIHCDPCLIFLRLHVVTLTFDLETVGEIIHALAAENIFIKFEIFITFRSWNTSRTRQTETECSRLLI